MVDGIDKVEGDLLGDRSLAPSKVVHISLGQGKLLRQSMLNVVNHKKCFESRGCCEKPELGRTQQWTSVPTRCLLAPLAGPTLN